MENIEYDLLDEFYFGTKYHIKLLVAGVVLHLVFDEIPEPEVLDLKIVSELEKIMIEEYNDTQQD